MTVKFTLASRCWASTHETKEINTIEDLIEIMKEYNEPIILFPEQHEVEEYWKAPDSDRFYYDFSDITLCVYDSYIE